MKNILLTLCLLFPFLSISCVPSQEEKAQALIRTQLNQMLPNIGSYEVIEIGEFEPAKICFQETIEAYSLLSELQSISDDMALEVEMAKSSHDHAIAEKHFKTIKELDAKFKTISDSINRRATEFHYDTTMVSMFHKFRYYDDKKRHHQIVPMTFYFNKDITKIKGIKYLYNDDSGPQIYSEIP